MKFSPVIFFVYLPPPLLLLSSKAQSPKHPPPSSGMQRERERQRELWWVAELESGRRHGRRSLSHFPSPVLHGPILQSSLKTLRLSDFSTIKVRAFWFLFHLRFIVGENQFLLIFWVGVFLLFLCWFCLSSYYL
jgi:hypothetical protein